MKKTVSLIKSCIKRAVFNKRFPAAIILTAFFEILDVFPIFLSQISYVDNTWYFSGDVLSFFRCFGSTLFGLITFTTAAFPYACSYCEDIETGFFTNIINRSGYPAYTVASFTACGFSSFLCIFLADLLFSGFFSLFFPLHSIYGIESYGSYFGKNYILLLFSFIILRSLRAAFFGIIVLLLSAFIQNRLVLLSLPFILFYFLMHIGYGTLSLPPYLNVRGIYFDFVFGDDKELQSLLYAFAFTITIGMISGILFVKKIRR